jgi:hypothetical protein
VARVPKLSTEELMNTPGKNRRERKVVRQELDRELRSLWQASIEEWARTNDEQAALVQEVVAKVNDKIEGQEFNSLSAAATWATALRGECVSADPGESGLEHVRAAWLLNIFEKNLRCMIGSPSANWVAVQIVK